MEEKKEKRRRKEGETRAEASAAGEKVSSQERGPEKREREKIVTMYTMSRAKVIEPSVLFIRDLTTTWQMLVKELPSLIYLREKATKLSTTCCEG
mmetsp:Transcript_41603/g.69323  ORF Transcript_41603/g.69323 Transcript_41603/m.69323 type:complete len:95 (+) Transcript_41603:223-507(+)